MNRPSMSTNVIVVHMLPHLIPDTNKTHLDKRSMNNSLLVTTLSKLSWNRIWLNSFATIANRGLKCNRWNHVGHPSTTRWVWWPANKTTKVMMQASIAIAISTRVRQHPITWVQWPKIQRVTSHIWKARKIKRQSYLFNQKK